MTGGHEAGGSSPLIPTQAFFSIFTSMENNKINPENDNQTGKNFTIKDLEPEQRPREMLIRDGAENLSDDKLLAIIIGSGVQGESVLITANRVLSKFAPLQKLVDASPEDLMEIKGIGKAKAAQLCASFEIARRIADSLRKEEKVKNNTPAITNADMIVERIRLKIPDYSKENFFIVCMDIRGREISIDRVSEGSLSASIVHPRETFEKAIRRHAAQMIVSHNHPSGDKNPSAEDINITKRLLEAGKIMGIELLDHIIVTRNDYFSFKEHGLI